MTHPSVCLRPTSGCVVSVSDNVKMIDVLPIQLKQDALQYSFFQQRVQAEEFTTIIKSYI